jgi:hypothetical protein
VLVSVAVAVLVCCWQCVCGPAHAGSGAPPVEAEAVEAAAGSGWGAAGAEQAPRRPPSVPSASLSPLGVGLLWGSLSYMALVKKAAMPLLCRDLAGLGEAKFLDPRLPCLADPGGSAGVLLVLHVLLVPAALFLSVKMRFAFRAWPGIFMFTKVQSLTNTR